MGSPGNLLDRFASMRSADDDVYKNDRAGLLSPQDNNALSRMVNRTLEVDDRQWAALHCKSEGPENSEELKSAETSVDKGTQIPKVPKGSHQTWFWRRGLPVLNPYSKVYAWWSAFVLLMDATYTAFVVPIGVGFNTSSVQWDWVGVWDFIAGVTFAGELLLGWNVAFVATHNLRKRIVLKRSNIAKFYLHHSTFLFDFISTIVFVVQCIGYGLGSAGSSTGTIIQVIQILRAMRLLRLLKLLQQLFVMSLTAPQTHVPLINRAMPVWLSYLTQLMYIVGLFINFLACLWVFVALREKLDNTWINNYEYFVSDYAADSSASSLTRDEAVAIPGPTVYLAAAYWSLTTMATIGFGDILPTTNAERAVMLFVQITGVLFFGILLGSITSLLQRASQEVKDAQMFREKMGSVQEWMSRVKLPRDLKQKIRGYYAEVWVRQHLVEHDLQLFKELPQHLRAQVAWRSNKPVFDKIHTFQELSEETQFMIAARAKPVKIAPGHELCSQGDPADCVWLLHEGEVIATYHYHEAETEKAPAICGYTALLAGSEGKYSIRPCGYRALTPCMLWEITMQELQPIVDWQEDVAEHLEAAARAHLVKRQSAYPHLWGLSSNFGDADSDSSEVEDDGEGYDMDNDNVRHFSSEDDDMDTDRGGATLRRPKPSETTSTAQAFASENGHAQNDGEVQDTAYAAEGRNLASQMAQAASGAGTDAEHVLVDMPSVDGSHHQRTPSDPKKHQRQPGHAKHSLSMPHELMPDQQQFSSGAGQRLHAATMSQQHQHEHSMGYGQEQQRQIGGEGEQANDGAAEERTKPHDSAHSQEAAQAAGAQAHQRSLQRGHGSRSGRRQVSVSSQQPPETEEGDSAPHKQLGLARHQQHQLFQQQRQEQEQQQRQEQQQQQQEQKQEQQQQEQLAAAASGLSQDSARKNRRGMLSLGSRAWRKASDISLADNDVDKSAPGRPAQAPAPETTKPIPKSGHQSSTQLIGHPADSPASGHSLSSPEQAASRVPSQSPFAQDSRHVQSQLQSGVGDGSSTRRNQSQRHHRSRPSPDAPDQSSGLQPLVEQQATAGEGLAAAASEQLQHQSANMSDAAEQIRAACWQLQRQLQQHQWQLQQHQRQLQQHRRGFNL